ncbi:cytochrome b [Algimonas porphyrae]|uniref:Cytochrome b n=1 Tax=Algimonas porphyrae TaxID=1128113 RepID=A0ABQ5V4I8_9PROT|nr:cytochrome b [Algimonas porphyrae]GLQ21902.1 cytochrome b [Algimonas porphyrae]
MAGTTHSARYTRVAIVLHWTIALLIIGLIVFGLLMTKEWMPNRFAIYQLHKSFGITVLALSIVRLIWRLRHKPPALPDAMPGWQQRASHLTHGVFYGLMFVMPLLGWAMVSASDLPIPTVLFGVVPLPDLPGLAQSEALEARFKALHEIGAKLFIGLIVLHVGAALKHQFIDRDGVLRRMLPILR